MAGVVIIGAGHGGVQLAASLREKGYSGAVHLVSADPDLPYHKPPLSKFFMKTPDAPLQPLRGAPFYAEKDITLDLGRRVEAIDRAGRQVHFEGGTRLGYDHLVLATGAEARRLSLPGRESPGVFTLRSAADARALRAALPGAARVVVIGGGFIGLEAAAMLAARGLAVSVVELAPRLLGRAASAEIAAAVAEDLASQGVEVITGSAVEGLEVQDGRVRGVRLSGRTLPADLVIAGIGAVVADALARGAGLDCDNGIVVDSLLATSDPAISALGDCAAFPDAQTGQRRRIESVQNATDQARALAATLTGTPTPYKAVPWFWSDIGAQKLQIAGLLEGADETIVTHAADGRLKSVYHLREGALVAVETLDSAGEHMLARRLLAEGLTPPRAVLASGDPAQIKAAYEALRETA